MATGNKLGFDKDNVMFLFHAENPPPSWLIRIEAFFINF